MRRLLPGLFLLGFAVLAAAATILDDRGHTVVMARPANRIVALAPHLAEIVFAAGAGAHLVGISAATRYPDEARRLSLVSSNGRVDAERIVSLKADLALAWMSGNARLDFERLENLGIPVVATEVRSLPDIARLIRMVGALAGTRAAAEQSAQRTERMLAQLEYRYAGARPISVFVEVWPQPLITVSGGHLISDVLRVCGGTNVFRASPVLTPRVSPESLLAARPEVILANAAGGEDVHRWRKYSALAAVREGRIHSIDPDVLHGQGPHLLEGVREVCSSLEQARREIGAGR